MSKVLVLEKLNLLKVMVFLMKSVKFLACTSRGFLGTAPLSTGHQLQISQVLWVPLNTTH